MNDPAMRLIEHESPRRLGHEKRDVNAPALVACALCLLAAIALLQAALVGYDEQLRTREARHASEQSPLAENQQPPPPRLQAQPAEELQRLQEQQRTLLNHYQWLDAEHDSVRIPIDRAMQLIAERGLPKVDPEAIHDERLFRPSPSINQEEARK